MQPQERVLRTLGQFQGNWAYVEQVALLTGLDEETTYDAIADLDAGGYIDLTERGQGKFLANLTTNGATVIGLVDVGTPPGVDPTAELAVRKFLPPDNIRWAGNIRFVFDGVAPPGCVGCGGPRVGNHAYCILCEPNGIQMPQIPLVRPRNIQVQPTLVGPRKNRLAAKKLKKR
jgi:hypothetical protein